MKCIFCRACNSLRAALLRKYDEDLRELSNELDIWEKELDQGRIRRADALWSTDPVEAVREYGAMAMGGSVFSMRVMGWAQETGTGTTLDLALAKHWYERALAAGLNTALFDLGRVHLAAGDRDEAVRVFSIGVARDWPLAMYRAAFARMTRDVGADREEARALLERARARGCVHAKVYLGNLLVRGRFGWRGFLEGLRLVGTRHDDIAHLLENSRPEDNEETRPRTTTPRGKSTGDGVTLHLARQQLA
jgi:TPR repeat protein